MDESNDNAARPFQDEYDWLGARRDYFDGAGSLRELSIRYGIPRRTLERRAAREAWSDQRAGLGGIVTAKAQDAAAEEGKRMGLSAAKLVERTLTSAEDILDRLDKELAKPDLDPQEIRVLIAGWRDVIQVGRQTHRLDDLPPGKTVINVAVLEVCTGIDVQQPVALASSCAVDGEDQKWNYEEAKGHIDARAVECHDCRTAKKGTRVSDDHAA